MARKLEDIWDGRFYDGDDMVRADCGGCKGCSSCCHGMGESVELDPYDYHQLAQGLGVAPEALLEGICALHMKEGVLLPHLAMSGKDEACVLLDEQGRCKVHAFRPGFCRLFPLGRYYEDGGFRYFLQKDECAKKNRTKIKVSRWLGIPNLAAYEEWIRRWHYKLLELQLRLRERGDEAMLRAENLRLLRTMYLTPVREGQDVLEELMERLEQLWGEH